jgi:ABC-2 type transport system permease protein
VVTLFADSFDLPGWVRRGSPFAHTPQVPSTELVLTPLLVIVIVAGVVMGAGYAGLRRRDVGY